MKAPALIPVFGAMIIAGAFPAAAADDQAAQILHAKAEACIRANAVEVERVEPSLSEATSFLLDDLCVGEIAAMQRYRYNVKSLTAVRQALVSTPSAFPEYEAGRSSELPKEPASRFDKLKMALARASVDPETGEIVGLSEVWPNSGLGDFKFESMTAPVDLRAVAARTLFEARRARLASHSSK